MGSPVENEGAQGGELAFWVGGEDAGARERWEEVGDERGNVQRKKREEDTHVLVVAEIGPGGEEEEERWWDERGGEFVEDDGDLL